MEFLPIETANGAIDFFRHHVRAVHPSGGDAEIHSILLGERFGGQMHYVVEWLNGGTGYLKYLF